MSLSVSKIQNEPIPAPLSNPAFKGKNGAKLAEKSTQKHKTDFANIINSSYAGIAGFALLISLLIYGWVSSCDHKPNKSENKTETPASLPSTSANTIDIDA